jgi:predicted esterase
LREKLKNYSSKQYKAKHEITDEMREEVRNWLNETIEIALEESA